MSHSGWLLPWACHLQATSCQQSLELQECVATHLLSRWPEQGDLAGHSVSGTKVATGVPRRSPLRTKFLVALWLGQGTSEEL